MAKDVCDILDLGNVSKACTNLDDDEKGITIGNTPGGKQEMLAVSESGLYTLIFRSRKPEAKRFSRWVRSEILPAIRKNGYYGQLTAKELIANPDILIELGNSLKQSQEQYLALTERYEV